MSLFRKKTTTKVMDQTEQTVNDFILRAPYWSYRPVPYRQFEPFFSYRDEIDALLDDLIRAQAVDDGNGDVMSNLINDMAERAFMDLSAQETDHKDIIKSLSLRCDSDQMQFREMLESLQEKLQETEKRLTEINRRNTEDEFEKKEDCHEKN